ncbi:PEGA domain-containing protein [Sorangium sp. So ce1182]|uniref:PEGA domain-containing protein n=1 Tax=Sorangium sp. So ce1182 TaxID=3133334 RepID=UPI003F64847E
MARVPMGGAVAAMLWVALAAAPPARAQDSAGAPGASAPRERGEEPEEAAPSEEQKEQARWHFEKGLTLEDQQAWAAAAAEFRLSRRLYPTRNATLLAARCLRRLQRDDEALELYEAFLREFSNAPADDKAEAQTSVDELRARVGTLDIIGAKPGAAIVVDGVDRGDYPPVNPIRVGAGIHTVRILKEGYAPFETRVEVAGGRTEPVPVKLVVSAESGRLKVAERSGLKLDVLVDGEVVGQTPWEGLLSVGQHSVALRGEKSLGTGPAAAPVKAGQLTTLSLRAEELEALLSVDPSPAGATVIIDGVSVGGGSWEGALRAGAHRIDVREDGFRPVTRQLSLARGQRLELPIALQRDEDAARWQEPPKFTFDVSAGLPMTWSFGGDVAGACDDSCSRSVGIGGLGLFHAGYESGSGWGGGVTLGYVAAFQKTTDREASITPFSRDASASPFDPAQGTADDRLRLSGFVVGAAGSFHTGERFPWLFRLGAGAVLGSVRDRRENFVPKTVMTDGAVVDVHRAEDTDSANFFYLAPEVRVGVRLGERIEISAGLQGLLLFAVPAPRFDDQQEVGVLHRQVTGTGVTTREGIGTYAADELTGSPVVLLSPSLGLRYAF